MGRVSVLVLDEVEALQAQLRSEAARANTAASEAAKVQLMNISQELDRLLNK